MLLINAHFYLVEIMHGQIVIGPPGSGKSTYCSAVQKLLLNLGRRVVIVNLDPANDYLQYHSDVDIAELISLEDVIDKLKLGPNGGLVYCMEVLDKNAEWLHTRLTQISGNKECYFLLDCPGQVELFTHHQSIKSIVHKMQTWGFKLTTVHLVDAHLCSDPGKFISALLTSLSTMYQIELPHVNVLSKVDLIQQYGKLAFGLDYYTEVLDLSYILEHLSDDPFFKKYKSLNKSIIGLVEDSSLVSFIPISVQDRESMQNLMKAVDKASGYIFHSEEGMSTPSSMMSSAMGSDLDFFRNATIREKYLSEDMKT